FVGMLTPAIRATSALLCRPVPRHRFRTTRDRSPTPQPCRGTESSPNIRETGAVLVGPCGRVNWAPPGLARNLLLRRKLLLRIRALPARRPPLVVQRAPD